jgi:hypothetical protein
MPQEFINMSKYFVALISAVCVASCAGQSPVTPSAAASVASLDAKPSASSPGIYQLTFNVFSGGAYQEVTSLPVSSHELILKAYVSDALGAPAKRGTVTFEYCSYGGPTNDINRPDEAPKEACAAGTASWARLAAMTVDSGRCPTLGVGYACVNFGVVRIPRDVGFRFRYSPQGSAVAAGMSEEKNFTWVAAQ